MTYVLGRQNQAREIRLTGFFLYRSSSSGFGTMAQSPLAACRQGCLVRR